MRRDFVGEGEPATGQRPERVFPGCDERVERTRSQSRTAGDERAMALVHNPSAATRQL